MTREENRKKRYKEKGKVLNSPIGTQFEGEVRAKMKGLSEGK